MSTLIDPRPARRGRELPRAPHPARCASSRAAAAAAPSWIAFVVLLALPWILAVAFDRRHAVRQRPEHPAGHVAASGRSTSPRHCLFVSAGFLLVVPVALFCGDTVASEASWSSLRYLLAAPVPRARLLR